MPTHNSVDAFKRSLDSSYRRFVDSIEALMAALVHPEVNRRTLRADEALNAAADLQRMLCHPDRPRWLDPIISTLTKTRTHLDNIDQSFRLLRAIAERYNEIRSQDWSFDDSTRGIDFEVIYIESRKNHGVTEKFEELIKSLEELIKSPEIDSIRVIDALESIVSALKKNQRGSYLATMFSFRFAKEVLTGWVCNELEKLPAVGGLFAAVRTALDGANSAVDGMNREICAETTRQANFPRATQTLPAPQTPKIAVQGTNDV